MNAVKSYEYKNDYLFFVLTPDTERGRGALIYCSGVNVDRFLPITRGRHRPMSNPAVRGLQLVNLGVRALVLSYGATPKSVRGKRLFRNYSCSGCMVNRAPADRKCS